MAMVAQKWDANDEDVDNEWILSCEAKNVLVYYEFSKCKWNDILSVRLLSLSLSLFHRHLSPSLRTS